jgi:hypothetical protein
LKQRKILNSFEAEFILIARDDLEKQYEKKMKSIGYSAKFKDQKGKLGEAPPTKFEKGAKELSK